MPVRVELILDAVDDLERCQRTGFFDQFLTKLVRIEDVGRDAGLPLGGPLTGWRKIIMGNGTWRIVFNTNPQNTVATVVAMADRDDDKVYELAISRLQRLGGSPETTTLAAALIQLLRPAQRRTKRRRS